jgi:hypothetical protein
MDTSEPATDNDFRMEIDYTDIRFINIESVSSNEVSMVEHRSIDNCWPSTDTRTSSLWLGKYWPVYNIIEDENHEKKTENTKEKLIKRWERNMEERTEI